MSKPKFKNGDKSTCIWCNKPIYLYDVHPGSPGTWLHERSYTPDFIAQFGANSAYCTEFRAIPVEDLNDN